MGYHGQNAYDDGLLGDLEEKVIHSTIRVSSFLSILGSVLLMGVHWKCEYFRKPIHRLIFYSSFGYFFFSSAYIMTTSAVHIYGLCQFQAFLIQWFGITSAFWIFCMAVNFRIVFRYGWTGPKLRRLEKVYLYICYGIPAVTAIVFYILGWVRGSPIYGPSVMSCFIMEDYDHLRLEFFYGPTWILIAGTIAVLTFTGYKMFKEVFRNRLPVEKPRRRCCTMPPFGSLSIKNILRGVKRRIKRTVGRIKYHFTLQSMELNSDNHCQPSLSPVPHSLHHGAIVYTKAACLMLFCLLLVWLPPTINRVRIFIIADTPESRLGFFVAHGFAESLGGFCAAIIYFATNYSGTKRLVEQDIMPGLTKWTDAKIHKIIMERAHFEQDVSIRLVSMGDRVSDTSNAVSDTTPFGRAESRTGLVRLRSRDH